MPSYKYLYVTRKIEGQRSAEAIDLLPPDSTVTAAAVLSADNLPPGEDDASDAVTDEDIPPA